MTIDATVFLFGTRLTNHHERGISWIIHRQGFGAEGLVRYDRTPKNSTMARRVLTKGLKC
jgi:hypothetical protein